MTETASLHYLTVQDVLWINLQVTKRVNAFKYNLLEEATFYQYSYGDSRTLVAQAAKLLVGFVKLSPFEAGNKATAFVAMLAFLHMNGFVVSVADEAAADWASQALDAGEQAPDFVNRVVAQDPNLHAMLKPDIRLAVHEVLRAYPRAIEHLSKE